MSQKPPYFPPDAPFSADQRQWLSGFFAGLYSRGYGAEAESETKSAAEVATRPVSIIYGTQTGNSEGLAHETAELAGEYGLTAEVLDMGDVTAEQIADSHRLLVVTSTYGEGEMPDNAHALWDEIMQDSAPRAENTYFSVLALGDTSYDEFCQAGKDWDLRLQQLGAKRVFERFDCDVDFDDMFAEWSRGALSALAEVDDGTEEAAPARPISATTLQKTAEKPVWNRKNPYGAELTVRRSLTGESSSKETLHYELSLGESGMSYDAGDILAVYPENCPELVDQIVAALGLQPESLVALPGGGETTLREALLTKYEVKTPSKELVAAVAERSGDAELQGIVGGSDTKALSDFMWGRDAIDLLLDYPKASFTADEFVELLKPLQARSYSIASSLLAHPGEVHLTIASVRYGSLGRMKKGVCSTWLADRLSLGQAAPSYLIPNKHFGIPASGDAPMIMVGPGTGVAPFRAFLEEREALGHKGKNWLFFGERNRASDYFYEDQFEAWRSGGHLGRLDLAFSRDQAEKVYVQDRMLEHGRELYDWLEDGGYFFVCGDAYRMAKDVDAALNEIVATHRGVNSEQASEYINQLKKEKRYVRDVY